jgi:hypothetical protein
MEIKETLIPHVNLDYTKESIKLMKTETAKGSIHYDWEIKVNSSNGIFKPEDYARMKELNESLKTDFPTEQAE